MVTFAILEGFRVKAYEKTGEVRVECRRTGCGRNMLSTWADWCCSLRVLASALTHGVTGLLLLLLLLHAWLSCTPRCQASSRDPTLFASFAPAPQTGLGPFAPFDPLNMRSDETRLKELKNGEGREGGVRKVFGLSSGTACTLLCCMRGPVGVASCHGRLCTPTR